MADTKKGNVEPKMNQDRFKTSKVWQFKTKKRCVL